MRNRLLAAGLALALTLPTWAIAQKERLLARGQVVLLELAPVDPRSLIQGDYMRLDYAVARAADDPTVWSRHGHVVVRLDSAGVARFVRVDDGTPLGASERRLEYRKRNGRVRIATDAYFFQEGTAGTYAEARYGELRVDDSGGSVLVGLRDATRAPIR
jgi:uncharacterized membrane-anchored protein